MRDCVQREDGLWSTELAPILADGAFPKVLWTFPPVSFYLFPSLPLLQRHICLALKSFSLSLSFLSCVLLGPKSWLCISLLPKLRQSEVQPSQQWTLSNFTLENSPREFLSADSWPHSRESDGMGPGQSQRTCVLPSTLPTTARVRQAGSGATL